MASERAPGRASARVKPHRVRGRELEEVRENDPDGRIVHASPDRRHSRQDAQAGTIIDQAMHDAAQATSKPPSSSRNLDPLRAVPILRVPGTGREPELNERQLDARRRVHEAMDGAGRDRQPGGLCVWHVVGLQRSVREWAIRQGWGGRPVRQEHAQGILVAALGMLVAHYGYGARRAS